MQQIRIIARRELAAFFDSLIAYILIIVFLGLSGFFTWLYGADVFLQGQANIKPFFSIAYWTMFFFIPALTMRMIAEEKQSGTIELLLTKAVSDWQLVLGKFLACLLLVAIALLCSLPFYFTVAWLGDVDHGAVWCGYIGILLMSSAYIGIGLFASSISNNQITAFLVALFIGSFFLIIFNVLAGSLSGVMANIFYYLSISTHYESITRGVLDTKDIAYFLSIAGFGMLLAQTNLAKRNAI